MKQRGSAMTDQQRDPENSDEPCEGPCAGSCRIIGTAFRPQDESLVDGSGTAFAPSCPAPLATLFDVKPVSLEDLRPGSRIDDFEIVSLLGCGAFGAVYLARQPPWTARLP